MMMKQDGMGGAAGRRPRDAKYEEKKMQTGRDMALPAAG